MLNDYPTMYKYKEQRLLKYNNITVNNSKIVAHLSNDVIGTINNEQVIAGIKADVSGCRNCMQQMKTTSAISKICIYCAIRIHESDSMIVVVTEKDITI